MNTSIEQSTTVNAPVLGTCEAAELCKDANGEDIFIPCWHHAEIPYVTCEGITKMLCKACHRKLWGAVLNVLETRVAVRLNGEVEEVA